MSEDHWVRHFSQSHPRPPLKKKIPRISKSPFWKVRHGMRPVGVSSREGSSQQDLLWLVYTGPKVTSVLSKNCYHASYRSEIVGGEFVFVCFSSDMFGEGDWKGRMNLGVGLNKSGLLPTPFSSMFFVLLSFSWAWRVILDVLWLICWMFWIACPK